MTSVLKMVADDVKRVGARPVSGASTLAGCFDYGWGGAAMRHQTRYVYEIDKKGSDGSATMIFPDDGDIPIADVKVNLNRLLDGDPD